MEFLAKYEEWVNNPYFDEETTKELEAIRGNEKEIQERFYKDLEFGTGGLRGILGAGTNRLNIYTIRKATQGLANYIIKEGEAAIKKGVVIAYDSRRMSPEFADEAALVLAANGVKAYVFESLRPTPVLSYALRQLECISGIVITASHNPPEYNGYKVYWEDGAQITAPKDVEIINEVNKVENYASVKTMDKETAIKEGLYNVVPESIDDNYIAELKKLVVDYDAIKAVAKDMTIVYTPLHGTGNLPVRRILKEIGFENVHVVKEQELPDGNFPTVAYPNPEDIKAFELAIKLGKEKNADIIMATDPDADRLGAIVKDSNGEYIALNGNMIGTILMDYIITRKKEQGNLPKNGAVVTTIVSTNMGKTIADYNGIKIFETLTGFKYIGEKIKEFKADHSYTYLFGYEESYGCLIGTHARDKDAVVTTMGLCEAAAYYKSKDMTLYDALLALYEKYGYYKETLSAITLKGIEGVEKIQNILSTLRNNPPKTINGIKVVKLRDYQSSKVIALESGEKTDTGLPKSNVLYFDLEGDSWVCVRPSGTEPKVKFYFGVKGESLEDVDACLEGLQGDMMKMIEAMI